MECTLDGGLFVRSWCEGSVPFIVALWYFRPIDQVIFLTRYFILCVVSVSSVTHFSKMTCLFPAKEHVM